MKVQKKEVLELELKLRFKDFCRLKRVIIISKALAPEWELDPSKGKLLLNLNLYLLKVVLYSYMGEIVLLPFTGSLMHQWSQLKIQFFYKLVGLDVYILYCSSHLRVYCVFAPIRSTKSTAFPAAEGTCVFAAGATSMDYG